MILNKNISPGYIKSLSIKEKKLLCSDIRKYLVRSVYQSGGHLSSNLGTVELEVAMHSVFDSPKDKFVFDVGHQAYTHKLITGRFDLLRKIRSEGGISGFPRSSESEHDAFIGGHSSISISAALGIAKGMQLKGDDHSVVAVIGDGAFTGGEAYEGLNNAGKSNCNLIVVLNENEMSISKNTGAFALYLAQIRSSQRYYRTKTSVKNIIEKAPLVGKNISHAIKSTKAILRNAIYQSNMFENFGFTYLGPLDGHNLEELTEALSVAKMIKKPCLVHIYTKKGKGYRKAEENPAMYHSLSANNNNGKTASFSEKFGSELCKSAYSDERICAVTAAMKYATGLDKFSDIYRERFFDVGIAEQHAVTFCAGLSSMGFIPVFAVYSSFLQRSFDQILHDCSIEKKHIVLAVDRAGLVGEDGETHNGVFDVPMLTTVPGITIYSPSDYKELSLCLKEALYTCDGIAAVRYPKGQEYHTPDTDSYSDHRYINNKKKKLIVTYGRISAFAMGMTEYADILQLIKIFPLNDEAVKICSHYNEIYFFEEGEENGGISEKLCSLLLQNRYKGKVKITALNGFTSHAKMLRQLNMNNLDLDGMKKTMGVDGS